MRFIKPYLFAKLEIYNIGVAIVEFRFRQPEKKRKKTEENTANIAHIIH